MVPQITFRNRVFKEQCPERVLQRTFTGVSKNLKKLVLEGIISKMVLQ